jgi:hypothetical protein
MMAGSGEETTCMEADSDEHFDEELDILTHSIWESETLDELEIMSRRAYYCATTPRDNTFRPEICLSRQEKERLVAELNKSTDRRRSGRLLRILYYALEDWMFPSLVPILEGPSRALAFEVLFIFRGTTAVGEYAEHFIQLMRGQPWDEVGSCQGLAMRCVGEYLYRHSHPALLRELLNIYESDEYEEDVREEALSSLGQIVGSHDLSPGEVVSKLRDRLAGEEKQNNVST